MNAVIIIPARYKSSRFPGKPLHMIEGKSLIKRVWEKCCLAMGGNNVYIATDDSRIAKHCKDNHMQYVMTSSKCLTGTDRVAEAYEQFPTDYETIINVQGDEPLIQPHDIIEVAKAHNPNDATVCCGMCKIKDNIEFEYPWTVKVVVDQNNHLLYASRSPIPMGKDGMTKKSYINAYKQVCIYAFNPHNLYRFKSPLKSRLESIEDIELLRLVERGDLIKMVEVSESSVAVDSKEDADKVSYLIRSGISE